MWGPCPFCALFCLFVCFRQDLLVLEPNYEVKERLWSTLLSALLSSGPALLMGITLAFPSVLLGDLELNSTNADIFGVSETIAIGRQEGGGEGREWREALGFSTPTHPFSPGYIIIPWNKKIIENHLVLDVGSSWQAMWQVNYSAMIVESFNVSRDRLEFVTGSEKRAHFMH